MIEELIAVFVTFHKMLNLKIEHTYRGYSQQCYFCDLIKANKADLSTEVCLI